MRSPNLEMKIRTPRERCQSHGSEALCPLSDTMLNISHAASRPLADGRGIHAWMGVPEGALDLGSSPGWGGGGIGSLQRRTCGNYWAEPRIQNHFPGA